MKKLKIALIGAGRRGAGAHLPVILALEDVFQLVAICDRDEETAKRLAQLYGVRAYSSVKQLVQQEALDCADVVVPADAHHILVEFLTAHKIHILCETPIAITLPLADRMIQSARSAGVVLEIAENYYRSPIERLRQKVLDSGVLGPVGRIYRLFHEGGYHGMSLIRRWAGSPPKKITGFSHSMPVAPHTDRMQRYHTSENWTMGLVEFQNQCLAIQMYSNIIHARSLGRGQRALSQIDGSQGTIVEDTVYLVPPEELEKGARAIGYSPERVTRSIQGMEVLQQIAYTLPEQTIVWENPFKDRPLTEGQISIASELMSLAEAIYRGQAPEYGAEEGRKDQEMNLAMVESGQLGVPVTLPVQSPLEYERKIHQRFEQEYGYPPTAIEPLLEVWFPRR